MDRKYREPKPSETVVFIGDNFINRYMYENFKRYSCHRPSFINNTSELKKQYDYMIDCTFNQKSQDETISYALVNKSKKVIIVNHWKRDIPTNDGIIIIQVIVPDVYGSEHMSFYRSGAGNNFESDINYCTLICETIRRIHESKVNAQPYTYIYYGESKIRYIYVENLYEPMEYIIDQINETTQFEVYDEEKNVSDVINTIKDVMEYSGNVIFENTNSFYNKSIKKLEFKHNYKSLQSMVKIIYSYLLQTNERFIIS